MGERGRGEWGRAKRQGRGRRRVEGGGEREVKEGETGGGDNML